MIVEVGHFYLNETDFDVSYLYDIKQYLPVDSIKVLFIDDYSFLERKLNLSSLKYQCEVILGDAVEIVYESSMVAYYDEIIALFNPKDICITRYRKQGVEKRNLVIEGELFPLATVEPYFKPTCLMLSLCWSLYRLEQGSTITVIDKKYYSVEEKVKKVISYIDDEQGSSLHEMIHLLVI